VLEYYRATGDEDAKTAFVNFMSKVVETDLTIIGCSGCTHELFDHSSVVQTEVNQYVKQETCVTVTLMKAFYQALCLTGDAKYADAMEKSAYNAMLGSINFNKNTSPATDLPHRELYKYDFVNPFVRLIEGYTFDSYAPLYKDKRNRLVGGFRRMSGDRTYGCCACIGASGVAVMPMASVMLSEDGVRINHFMNGEVKLGDLSFTMETAYPYGDTVTVRITEAPSEAFTIGVRVPENVRGKMTVNGKVAEPDALGYALVDKVWHKGDTLELYIPKEIVVHELNGKIALTSGVVVLALDERNESIDKALSKNVLSVTKIDTPFRTREAYRIEFEGGEVADFVDFASAGSEWDKPKNKMTVWIDAKA
jgi:DUF1680 family protein